LPANLDPIDRQKQTASEGFKKLKNAYFALASSPELGAALQPQWRVIDNLLQVPFLPAPDRAKLLMELRNISGQMLTKAEKTGAGGKVSVSAQEMAQQQGRMALAMLGARWVEDKG